MSHSRANSDRLFAKLLEGDLSPAEREQLQQQLRADASLRRLYRKYMTLDALLRWEIAPPLMKMGKEGPGTGGQRTEDRGQRSEDGDRVTLISPLFPLPTLSTTHYPLPTNFVGGPVFSYMVATIVLCLMLLGAWAYKITHDRDFIANNSRRSTTSGLSKQEEFVIVGRVTGMKDCRWSESDPGTFISSLAAIGREYALVSGLLEITYKSGAKVILEGPCTYRVESSAGGFLERGKLAARVQTKGSGFRVQKSEVGNHKSPNPQSLIPNPFVIRTPTAVVTDLGTEFGVEVDANGDTVSYVFEGKIVVQAGIRGFGDSG
ncbi:MAG: hypothetical protein JW959_09135, partial [Pirellulales bacterium]|nr:hypothetical protein [Pirellulales bacterium]